MNRSGVMTIDLFNKLTGKDTLHPLISLVDLSDISLNKDIHMMCDFYGLLYYGTATGKQPFIKETLRFVLPGETIEIPSACHCRVNGYTGVLFHPDLLCDTPLEGCIENYPTRCHCQTVLSERERQIILESLKKIGTELYHAIDRHSAMIITSHIELLLNYCVRFCNHCS